MKYFHLGLKFLGIGFFSFLLLAQIGSRDVEIPSEDDVGYVSIRSNASRYTDGESHVYSDPGSDGAVKMSANPPRTIPAVREWHAESGTYMLSDESRIVVDAAFADQLQDTAAVLAKDIYALRGYPIRVVISSNHSLGDIFVTLDIADDSVGEFGYMMTISGAVLIAAPADDGVFYGTRTLLQMLRQSATAEYRLANGVIRDWPDSRARWRALHLDVGRKYMSVEFIENHIRDLAYLKMNMLHLHLADNFGFRLESTSHPEITSVQHYTKNDIRRLLELARQYHVTIMPEIDFPGHADWAESTHEELLLDGRVLGNQYRAFNLSLESTYTFIHDLLAEYLPLFPGPYWHLGADEYMFFKEYNNYPELSAYAKKLYGNRAHGIDTYRHFVNWANDIVQSHGKTMWAWDDVRHYVGIFGVLNIDTSIILDFWSSLSWLGHPVVPQKTVDAGYRAMNSNDGYTYYVLGKKYGDVTKIYDNYELSNFSGGNVTRNQTKILGGKLHVWCDVPHAETESQIASNIFVPLRALAQKTWNSPKLVSTYDSFGILAEEIGRAPE